MNLESLRRKRVHRMGVKTRGYAGQRRIFFVLDRATRKFHGDIGLWMQYLGFAKQQKASKKVSQILTSVLRLHPARPELWIYAANYAMEERGDMTEARAYMQRGLRFCKRSRNLWIEYTKLEMIYMAKIAARRQILGLSEEIPAKKLAPSIDLVDADIIPSPALSAPAIDPSQQPEEVADQDALQRLNNTPALSGAIPIAIFDAAMRQFEGDASLGEAIFDMVAGFQGVPCLNKIQHHIVGVLLAEAPVDPATLICSIREPVIGVEVLSADFPGALNTALERLRTLQVTLPSSGSSRTAQPWLVLSTRVVGWILSFLDVQDLDQDIRKVLIATLKKLIRQYRIAFQQVPGNHNKWIAELATRLLDKGFKDLAKPLIAFGLQMSPSDPCFSKFQNRDL